ncbi:MAG TPA: AAA family ATPase, partial [Acidimicrobiales bacterium]
MPDDVQQIRPLGADAAGQVLLTKLSPPVIRVDLVHRSRLDELLERVMTRKLTLVDAPAGWGKTTLVGDWLARRRPAPTAWLSLDPDDGDPPRFWSYVIEACRTVHPSLGAGALELLRPPGAAPLVGALPVLVNELVASGQPLVLVLDDYHVIASKDIHREMAFLVDHLPSNVHLVVVTRSDPPLPIARWRVRGEVFEIRADELRFDADDAAALLNDRLGLGLAEDSLASLHKRTEGWVAGMHLAALSLQRHPDRDTFIDGFAGDDRHIVDYFGSEVLDGLPDETRAFLLPTSILDRLTGALCDAVAGTTGSDRLLADIERVNHFLIPLDTRGRWYRYHQL